LQIVLVELKSKSKAWVQPCPNPFGNGSCFNVIMQDGDERESTCCWQQFAHWNISSETACRFSAE